MHNVTSLHEMSDLIEPYLRHLRAGGRSTNTIKLRAVVLRRLATSRHLPYGLDQAATHELAEFLGTYTGWTLYTYHQAIRDYYGWATGGDDPWLTWDPTADLIRPTHPDLLPDPVTDDELRTALERSDAWWTDVILLAAKAGLRASEIAQLHREDITEHSIVVRRGKGGDPQSVPTDAELWQRLQHRGQGHVVLGRQRHRPMTGGCLSAQARVHFDALGLPRVHLHRFRHWYATTQLAAGADIRTVQENLRHRSVTSTQAYTLVTSAQRRAAVDALPRLGGAPAGV